MRQTIAALPINPLSSFYGIGKATMPFRCYATLRSLSHFLQFLLIPHGSYCVLHATSFISSFVPLHCITFVAKLRFKAGILSQSQNQPHRDARLSQPYHNTHYIPFRSTTSFIHFSSVQSTRCLCCCARLAACPGCGFVMVFVANLIA